MLPSRPGEHRAGGSARRSRGVSFSAPAVLARPRCSSCEWTSRHSRTRALRQEVLAQQLLVQLAVRLLVLADAAFVSNQFHSFEPPQELGLLVVELAVRLVGRACALDRPVAHVLHRQRAGDDQHFAQRLLLARREDHAADARIERQARELAAERRELRCRRRPRPARRAADSRRRSRGRGGGSRNGKVFDAAEVQRLHAQDHAGQRRAQDLRIGEARRGR